MMKNVNDVISSILGSKKNKDKYYRAYLQLHWQEIVGDGIAKKSFPNDVQNNIIFLNVVGSTWAHSLLTMKYDLIRKIRKYLNNKFNVEDIKITVVAKVEALELEKIIEEKIVLPELDSKEQLEITNLISDLKDKELLKKISFALTKDKRYKKYYLEKGFRKCVICGVPLTYEEEECTVCRKNAKLEVSSRLLKLFIEIPWIAFEEAKQQTSCDEKQYSLVKKECEQFFFNKAIEKNAPNSDIRRYVMIKNNCPVFSLTEDLIESTMEKARRSYYVPSSRFRRNGGY